MAQPNHQMGKRHQDEWTEEDDLLGGDLGQAQDLRSQIQRGGRNQVEPNQVGFERWRGLEEVEMSVQVVGNRADHRGSKGASHTVNKATGSNRGGRERIVGQQRDLEVHLYLTVLDLVPFRR